MRRQPIYVETDIRTDIDTIWQYTQNPDLHQQWDLRFSEIHYLPREHEDVPQRFAYRTRIGFGLDISGTGVTKATLQSETGERTSALTFGSEQPLSLIRTGGGYWKYTPKGDHVTFMTRYDYQTRLGVFGTWFDRLLFRPLFGYATAWSFDLLRIWLEKRIPPAVSIQRAVIHYLCVVMLTALWLYEGAVPKLLFPYTGELALVRDTGWFPGREGLMLQALGAVEMGFGFMAGLFHRTRRVYVLQAILLALLACAAIAGNPNLLVAPFNPLTLSLPMIGLCAVAYATTENLPCAGRARRKSRGIHLSASAGT